MRFAMKIAYLGSRYHGWQRQPDVVTVEGTILQAFKKVNVLTDLKIWGIIEGQIGTVPGFPQVKFLSVYFTFFRNW